MYVLYVCIHTYVSKGIVKKLTKAAKQKGCKELSPWIQSISNHLWWSCQTCKGDSLLLKEKWISVFHHWTNEHTWGDSEKFEKRRFQARTNSGDLRYKVVYPKRYNANFIKHFSINVQVKAVK